MEFKSVREANARPAINPGTRPRAFIQSFLEDNEQNFKDAMDNVYEHDKKAYAKLYIELQKIVMPKEQGVNVNIGISKDMEQMMMLGRAAAPQQAIDAKPVEEAEFQDMTRGIAEMEAAKKKEKEKAEKESPLPLPPVK